MDESEKDDEDINKINEALRSMIPFSVIGSENQYENGAGKSVRGRKYLWGLAEVDNKDHCDFVTLRSTLLE